MKATKIVAMLETKQHQAKSEWEIKEHKVLRKLERLDLYQVPASHSENISNYIFYTNQHSRSKFRMTKQMGLVCHTTY